MFDFHMHSKVSFDSEMEPKDMVARAKELGLKEICFTSPDGSGARWYSPAKITKPPTGIWTGRA